MRVDREQFGHFGVANTIRDAIRGVHVERANTQRGYLGSRGTRGQQVVGVPSERIALLEQALEAYAQRTRAHVASTHVVLAHELESILGLELETRARGARLEQHALMRLIDLELVAVLAVQRTLEAHLAVDPQVVVVCVELKNFLGELTVENVRN